METMEEPDEEQFEATATLMASQLVQAQLSPWDPIKCTDWENQKPSQLCLLRIKRFVWQLAGFDKINLCMCYIYLYDIQYIISNYVVTFRRIQYWMNRMNEYRPYE